ncbi:MAG: ACT domain-containing protein, partial [Sulfurovaceae bacterium]|nr:ACT domain-containing protein [Sulfurovaceae bacterium]
MSIKARVLIDCDDEKGLVYKISKVFFDKNLNIESNQEFVDSQTNRFFMRTVVTGEFDPSSLQKELIALLSNNSNIKVIMPQKKKIVIMATKESHALG